VDTPTTGADTGTDTGTDTAIRADAAPASLSELEARITARRDGPAYGHEAQIVCDRLVRIFTAEGIEVQALQGLDLLVREGELMALVGKSGSGKSTLLNILAGLDVPTAGAAKVAGHDLLSMSERDRLRYRQEVVGFVWQQTARNLLPYMTALQNVLLPLQLRGLRKAGGRAAAVRQAEELLAILGIADCRDRRPEQLSGGQQQRAAIAVALANHPKVLLGDEPTGQLESTDAAQIFAAFRRVNEELGTTIVLVTHDRTVADEVPRTVAIRDGRTSSEVLRQSSVDAATGHTSVEAREYAMLDRVGRLQLPADYISRLEMKDRVQLELEPDHIGVWPDRDRREAAEGSEGTAEATGRDD
jgi:ABC-type lipoprotein export system ATPase subunit